jgi:PTS system nitrogen regulatory IIA component
MNTSVKEAARLLSVSEKTIYRWIKREIVPAYKVHESYRFNRAELLEWATSRRLGIAPEVFEEPEAEAHPLPNLSASLENGGVFYRIDGGTREKALADTVAHLRLPDDVDRDLLYRMLLARERIASTGVGNGIAIPHPRDPVPLHATRSTVTLCFLEHAADFQALDGRPVDTLFTVITPTRRAHLHLLSLLGFVLRDPDFLQVLRRQGSREEIFTALRSAEERLKK